MDADQDQERGGLRPVTFRRSCREGSQALRDRTSAGWAPACLKPIEEVKGRCGSCRSPHMPAIKDLGCRICLRQVYAQYRSIEPRLKAEAPPPPGCRTPPVEGGAREAGRAGGNASCVQLLFRLLSGPAPVGTGDRYRRPCHAAAGLCWRIADSRDEATGGTAGQLWRIHPAGSRCHTIVNWHAHLPEGHSIAAEAIGQRLGAMAAAAWAESCPRPAAAEGRRAVRVVSGLWTWG